MLDERRAEVVGVDDALDPDEVWEDEAEDASQPLRS